jgi:hypothetical protein
MRTTSSRITVACRALARGVARLGRSLAIGLRAGAMGPLATLLLLPAGATAERLLSGDQPGGAGGGGTPSVAATLEQCAVEGAQSERSATFSAEMTAIAGTQRMAIRIEVQERMPGEAAFHNVSAPGIGVWRSSDAGVKIYKYLKQVTNPAGPAVYRGAVRFRWVNSKDRVIRRAERRTATCVQPPLVTIAPSPPAAGAPTPAAGAPPGDVTTGA